MTGPFHCCYYPREMKVYVHTKMYTQMHLATELVIAENWKQPKCLSAREWTSCGHCILGTAMKRNELLIQAAAQLNLRLSKRSRHRRVPARWFHFYELPEKANRIRGGEGRTAKQQEETLGLHGKVLYLNCSGHFPSVYIVKTHPTVCFIVFYDHCE